jgi:hypothetical protein
MRLDVSPHPNRNEAVAALISRGPSAILDRLGNLSSELTLPHRRVCGARPVSGSDLSKLQVASEQFNRTSESAFVDHPARRQADKGTSCGQCRINISGR